MVVFSKSIGKSKPPLLPTSDNNYYVLFNKSTIDTTYQCVYLFNNLCVLYITVKPIQSRLLINRYVDVPFWVVLIREVVP